MYNKKGQAALEFMATYGWAILVVMIAIGALAYFGVLNPSKFLSDKAAFPAGFGSDSNKVLISSTDANTLKAELSNGFGTSLNITNVTVSGTHSAGCVVAIDGTNMIDTNSVLIDEGDTFELTLNSCTDKPNKGDSQKYTFEFTYILGGNSNYPKTGQGEIFAKVQ